jgi:hypothetical protein
VCLYTNCFSYINQCVFPKEIFFILIFLFTAVLCVAVSILFLAYAALFGPLFFHDWGCIVTNGPAVTYSEAISYSLNSLLSVSIIAVTAATMLKDK